MSKAKNTGTGSDQWIAERLAQASQYAGTAGTFGEREAELRADGEDKKANPSPDKRAHLLFAADEMLAQRRHFLALSAAILDDVLPFLTSYAKREI